MRLTRMYLGDDGTSQFEDIEIGLKEFDVGAFTRNLRPDHMSFRISEPVWSTTGTTPRPRP